jgi:hypothetical protein
MRENRTYGSEGGEAERPFLPLPRKLPAKETTQDQTGFRINKMNISPAFRNQFRRVWKVGHP